MVRDPDCLEQSLNSWISILTQKYAANMPKIQEPQTLT